MRNMEPESRRTVQNVTKIGIYYFVSAPKIM